MRDSRQKALACSVGSVSVHGQHMAPLERTEKFQMRLTPEEKRMLDAVADADGLSGSDAVRLLIRQRYNALAAPAMQTAVLVDKAIKAPARPLKVARDATKPGRQNKKASEPVRRAQIKKR
jgi:hypothetical protein